MPESDAHVIMWPRIAPGSMVSPLVLPTGIHPSAPVFARVHIVITISTDPGSVWTAVHVGSNGSTIVVGFRLPPGPQMDQQGFGIVDVLLRFNCHLVIIILDKIVVGGDDACLGKDGHCDQEKGN